MQRPFVDLYSKSYEDICKYLENKNFSFERKGNTITIKYTIDVDDLLRLLQKINLMMLKYSLK